MLLVHPSYGFILSKARPVHAEEVPEAYSYFSIYFHGLEFTTEELIDELKQEIVFPTGGQISVQEAFAWSLARIPMIETILAAHGYYDAKVDFFVDIRSTPPVIYFHIKPGALFTLGAFSIRSDPPHRGPVAIMAQDVEQFGAKLGMPANKYKIQEAKEAILGKLGEAGFAFATITGERFVLNRSKKTLLISFIVRANKLVRYGNIYLEGNAQVTPEFLKSFLNWEKGDVYNAAVVKNVAQSLMDTGAFKDVYLYLNKDGSRLAELTPEEIEKESDAPSIMLDLHFHLIPGEATRVRLQGRAGDLSEAIGFEGVRFNRLQKGETFFLDTFFSSLNSYITPRLLFTNLFGYLGVQSVTSIQVGTERFHGFTADSFKVKQSFDYALSKNFGVTMGLFFDYARYPELHPTLEAAQTTGSWNAFVGLVFKGLDDPVRPAEGWLLKLTTLGSLGMFGQNYRMSRVQLSARLYTPLNRRKTFVWENWLRAFITPTHTTLGEDSKPAWDIPLHKLFYIGGPQGIRGYRRQPFSKPPRSFTFEPQYSMIMLGTQVNYSFNKHFTVSAFMDMGETFTGHYPTITWPMHYSIGGAARIITKVGALSFSLATPLRATPFSDSVEYSISFMPIWAV